VLYRRINRLEVFGRQVKKNEMHTKLVLKEKGNLGDLSVDGRVI
jgi:hypothetical protein